jgi:hypothetical protein
MSIAFLKKHRFVPAALATAFLVGGMQSAEAGWSRKGGGTGPHAGTWSSTGSGSCSGGTCSSHQSFTGPLGRVTTRDGSISCASGSCTSSATVTGPNGRRYTRSGTITRN